MSHINNEDIQQSVTIKSLPELDRPRERLFTKGPSFLSNTELLSIILGKGFRGRSVNLLSEQVLSMFNGLTGLKKVSTSELFSIKGIGLAKACQIVACIEISRRLSESPVIRSNPIDSSDKVYELIRPYLLSRQKEHFILVSLDSRKKLIAIDNISIGSLDHTIVHPREVFKTAINRRAASVILAHNHPSGDPEPSIDDITITERLISVSLTIGIPIIDHIIVGEGGYISLKKEEFIG